MRWFLTVLFILLFDLIIFGLLVKPKLPSISISTGKGVSSKQCMREKVACNTDSDCGICSETQEGEEIVCKRLPDISSLTETQKSLLNATGGGDLVPSSYCVPASAKLNCNIATGGIPIFSGWGDVSRMEFDCLASYPLWANSTSWKDGVPQQGGQLNPDICRGGVFNWDLTKKVEEPSWKLCTCGQGDTLVVDNSGLPRCVPAGMGTFYQDLAEEK